MDSEIWLMRHGAYGEDGSLDAEGIAQVKAAAANFFAKDVTIYHSPVQRCVETARLVGESAMSAQYHAVPWLGMHRGFPENCLSLCPGEIVIIVSHSDILPVIAKQNGRTNIYFQCGKPIRLA